MGYVDLTIIGSDLAADFMSNVCYEVAKCIKAELKLNSLNKGTPYNTPGCVNAAMFFKECLSNSYCWIENSYTRDPLYNAAKLTLKEMDKLIKDMKENKEEYDNGEYMYHLTNYKKLRNNIKKWIDEVDEKS